MKRMLVLLLLLMLYATSVVYADELIEIPIKVEVDFRGEREFRLDFPNNQYDYEWNENRTASDDDFTYDHIFLLDTDKYCLGEAAPTNTFTKTMEKMLLSCTDIMRKVNQSEKNLLKAQEALKDRDIYENDLNSYKQLYKDQRNVSSTYQKDLDSCEEDRDRFKTSADRYTICSKDLQDAENDLKDCDSSKNNTGFLGFGAGLALMWFINRNKNKKQGPSEQMQTGYVPDAMPPPRERL